MTDPLTFIHVAYKLSMLSFYLGVLVYALPVPWRGVKRWAPILIADGIFTLILLLSMDVILNASNTIARMTGGSWELFQSWLTRILGILLDFKLAIASLKMLPDIAGITDGILYALSPIDKAVNAAIFFAAAIAGVAWIVRDLGFLLLAIGLALYAVPFRISRGAGAWLIAFVLVFNAGLQVMPVFISAFAGYSGLEDPEEPKLGFTLVRPYITGYDGSPIGYGILEAEYYDNVILRLPVRNGLVESSLGDMIMLPPRGTVYFYLVNNGVRFPLDPSPINIEDVRSNLTLSLTSGNIVYADNRGLLVYTTGTPLYYNLSSDRLTVATYLHEGSYLEFRAPSGCITILSYNGTLRHGTIVWYNIRVGYVRIDPDTPGFYTATVAVSQNCRSSMPSFDRVEWNQGATSLLIDIDVFTSFIVYYFTIPLLYYTMLFAITLGIARLLGGRENMIIRVS